MKEGQPVVHSDFAWLTAVRITRWVSFARYSWATYLVVLPVANGAFDLFLTYLLTYWADFTKIADSGVSARRYFLRQFSVSKNTYFLRTIFPQIVSFGLNKQKSWKSEKFWEKNRKIRFRQSWTSVVSIYAFSYRCATLFIIISNHNTAITHINEQS